MFNTASSTQKITAFLAEFASAVEDEDGNALGKLLSTSGGPHIAPLRDEVSKVYNLENIVLYKHKSRIDEPWNEIALGHLKVLRELAGGDLVSATQAQNHFAQSFHNAFNNQTNWCLPALYVINRDLRELSIKADSLLSKDGQEANSLEVAARTINRAFTYCITDRFSALDKSRKWGTYYISALLMKTYFRLKQTNLCTNVVRAVSGSDLPDIERFPAAHRVLYRYHIGLMAFRNEEYTKASVELMYVLEHILAKGTARERATYLRNRSLVLNYLIPIRLLSGILPHTRLLSKYPGLSDLYTPFVRAIREGNVKLFDESFIENERRLIRHGTYLTVERCRAVCVRTLFKRVWLVNEMNTRIPMRVFQTALHLSGTEVDMLEVECMLANMIDKGYMKGYLSHEKQFVVLSQKDPFPSLDTLPLVL
ncbi:hypothetical protein BJ742DRAFT_765927 [Cladochytrium replicatum]|nr:hypothetical protein BJ742DRAFT_765927 [Cladochytrium replicatum]